MNAPKHILVVTYWNFDDALVQTYTLPYLRIIRGILPEGSLIHLVTFEKNEPAQKEIIVEEKIYNHRFRQFPFGVRAIFERMKTNRQLKKLACEKNISVIHAWCTPAGALAWRISRKTGLPLIIDSYEPHAEAMVENGTWKKNGLAHRLLFWLEKKQTFHAAYLICAAKGMQDYAREKYGYSGDNFFFKPACIDTAIFNPEKRKNKTLLDDLQLTDKIVGVYAGKTGGIYLEKELFDLFSAAAEFWGEKFRALFLTSTCREKIDSLATDSGVDPRIIISRFVPHAEIPQWMGLGDFGLTPVKPVPTKKYCSPIKDGEYWGLGLPVIITKGISEDSEIIEKSGTGYVLKDLSAKEMRNAVEKIDKLMNDRNPKDLSSEIHQLAVTHRNFNMAETIYRKIYAA